MRRQQHATMNTHRIQESQLSIDVRKAYKVTKKLVKMKTRRIFLLKCKHNQLCPRFLKMKTKHIVFSDTRLSEKFRKAMERFIRHTVNLLITDTAKQINKLGVTMENILKFIEDNETPHRSTIIRTEINERFNNLMSRYSDTHTKKLNILRLENNDNTKQMNTSGELFKSSIENYTSMVLPTYLTQTLALGAKFAIENNDHKMIPIHDILARVEAGIDRLSANNQNDIRMKVLQTLNTHIKEKKERKQGNKNNLELANLKKQKNS
ncbi:hypothetical protein WA026_021907 [Henosepilachna vigintioctopunctata]|uniref:Uncharacterized protein n=1 Tax=Henosepilachna vigintioctopunctata TaxID=420089 RepID=A0AAW1URG1_9CUCU